MTKRKGEFSGPGFIGVGPEKTGTTWMYRNLRDHPSIHLPPIKELRYFLENREFPRERPWARLARPNVSWHRAQYRRHLQKCAKQIIRHPWRSLIHEPDRLIWHARYLFSVHDDEWYLSSFQGPDGALTGEFSPQYFFLPVESVKRIRDVLPGCKVIISLREPVDWVWSYARMIRRSGYLAQRYGTIENFIQESVDAHSFSDTIRSWQRYFPADQLLVVFYDDLQRSPWRLYARICDFLGLPADVSVRSRLAKVINAGPDEPMPRHCAELAERGWRADVDELATIVPGVPRRWLKPTHGVTVGG